MNAPANDILSFARNADGSNPAAAIFGVAGLILTEEERTFFARVQPFGFILFARNCQSPEQVKTLVDSLRALTGRPRVPVLIDQEGRSRGAAAPAALACEPRRLGSQRHRRP